VPVFVSPVFYPFVGRGCVAHFHVVGMLGGEDVAGYV